MTKQHTQAMRDELAGIDNSNMGAREVQRLAELAITMFAAKHGRSVLALTMGDLHNGYDSFVRTMGITGVCESRARDGWSAAVRGIVVHGKVMP